MTPQVLLYSVRDNRTKLLRIAETAQASFHQAERILFFVEDERAAQFLDEFFWKTPETAFLPHAIHSLSDWISISIEKKNINQAKAAFNLCPTPLLIHPPFRTIYDFEDLTHPDKRRLSALRFDAYKKAGFSITSN